MGAHSLGMASKSNSGYQGIWTPGGQFSLDSDYYANMIDPNRTWQNKVCTMYIYSVHTLKVF